MAAATERLERRLLVTFTPEQEELVRRAAHLEGVKVATFLRRAALARIHTITRRRLARQPEGS